GPKPYFARDLNYIIECQIDKNKLNNSHEINDKGTNKWRIAKIPSTKCLVPAVGCIVAADCVVLEGSDAGGRICAVRPYYQEPVVRSGMTLYSAPVFVRDTARTKVTLYLSALGEIQICCCCPRLPGALHNKMVDL